MGRTVQGDWSALLPKTGRDLEEEYAWLKSPPAEYRGCWVALVGHEVIAVADSLERLKPTLASYCGPTTLAVEIAP